VSGESTVGRFSDRVQAIGVLITPPALLTSLLYYFATVREQALFGYFGISTSVLDFSAQDYLTRSVGVMFLPLAATMFAGLAAVAAHIGLLASLETPPGRRHHRVLVRVITVVLATAAALLLTIGLVRLTNHRFITRSAAPAAIALGVGALVTEYTFIGPTRFRARRGAASPADERPPADESTADDPPPAPGRVPLFGRRLVIARRALVGGLLITAVFWATTLYADNRGAGVAKGIARDLATERGVVLYSVRRLEITGPGVHAVVLDDRSAAYRFRYEGLDLLIRSNGRLFLLPVGWRRGFGAAVVISDDPASVRLDFLT
jgi:hypothetical protein